MWLFWLPLTRVRVSGGHLCKAEAPTEAVAETLSSETRLKERKGKVIMYLNPFSPSVTAMPCHLPRQREALVLQYPYAVGSNPRQREPKTPLRTVGEGGKSRPHKK